MDTKKADNRSASRIGPTRHFFGYEVYAGEGPLLVYAVAERIAKGKPSLIFALNPNKAVLAYDDASLRGILLRADALIADGVGITLAARLAAAVPLPRITGIALMEALLSEFENRGVSVFFYGAEAGTIQTASENIQKSHPNLRIAGLLDGYSLDVADAASAIAKSGATALFVGLGSPKQEMFLDEFFDSMPQALFAMGVGGSFDVYSGKVARAPESLQKLGLEWLWRLAKKPSRLKQNHLARFIWLALFKRGPKAQQ